MIKAGATLIEKLDAKNIRSDAALWFFFPDIKTWKLILAEGNLASVGPKDIYKKIQKTLSENTETSNSISLDDVVLAKPDAPIISLLRIAIKTGPEISGVRFTNNVINSTVIDDAYIYRLL